jgi:hypothetical protein
MNRILFFLLIWLTSCNYNLSNYTKNSNPVLNIFHKYDCQSEINAQSDFNPLIRKIEFDYSKNKQNATVEVKIMMTTALPEGELTADHELVLYNGETIKIHLNDLVFKDYIESLSTLTQQPVSSQQTITHPKSTNTVTKSDGTKETIVIPAKTEVVNISQTIYQPQVHNKTQIFNQGKFTLSREEFNKIKLHKLRQFNFNTKYSKLRILPTDKQIKELNNYFFVVL